jgi:RND superfamily putative drug exporter
MLERWGWFVVRRRRTILAVGLIGSLVSVWATISLPDRLSLEFFVDRHSEAYKGQRLLQDEFGVGSPNVVLVISAPRASVDDPQVAEAGQALVDRFAAEPDVTNVTSYWSAGRPAQLRSRNGDRALMTGRILGTDGEVRDRLNSLVPRYEQTHGTIDVRVGGFADTLREMVEIGLGEFQRAEVLTVPVTLLALLFVFGSVAAATLPLLIAAVTVLGTTAALWLLTTTISVSTFSVTLTSALGLGLAIDYSLFMVSRYREELAAGFDRDVALVRAVCTAGRTVLFSAGAVALALAALLPIPLDFLRSFGISGTFTAAIAGLAALIVLPALLASLGPNVNRLTVWRRTADPVTGAGAWHRIAMAVMKRPKRVAAALITILLVAGAPIFHLNPGLLDDRHLPAGSRSRTTGQILRTEFDVEGAVPLSVVLPGTDASARASDIDRYATRVSGLPHVRSVLTTSGVYAAARRVDPPAEQAERYRAHGSTFLEVFSDRPPLSKDSELLVEAIRALPSPFSKVVVTGEAANVHDVTESIMGVLPGALLFIALATGLALFLQFGSVLVPLKAILLNMLSLTALFGGLVWVFQDGHLSSILGFTATGTLYIVMPITLFCLAFGLSMDYELFLLSRIKEEYDRSGDNQSSIALGLERSGRIVSAAAVLISLVFLIAGLTSSIAATKMFGLGLAAIVLLDAFVIRGTLVPAFMRLAGAANWWAPRPLRWLHDRIGFREHVELRPAPPSPDPSSALR